MFFTQWSLAKNAYSESSVTGKELVLSKASEPKYTCGPEDIEYELEEERVVSETWSSNPRSERTHTKPSQAYAGRFKPRHERDVNANAYEQHHAPPSWGNPQYAQSSQQLYTHGQSYARPCCFESEYYSFPPYRENSPAPKHASRHPAQPTAEQFKSADERKYDELLTQREVRTERLKRLRKSRNSEPWPGHDEEVRKWEAEVLALSKKRGLDMSLKRKVLLL
jgi:hypothetical protein